MGCSVWVKFDWCGKKDIRFRGVFVRPDFNDSDVALPWPHLVPVSKTDEMTGAIREALHTE
jgi:hypothetical protein